MYSLLQSNSSIRVFLGGGTLAPHIFSSAWVTAPTSRRALRWAWHSWCASRARKVNSSSCSFTQERRKSHFFLAPNTPVPVSFLGSAAGPGGRGRPEKTLSAWPGFPLSGSGPRPSGRPRPPRGPRGTGPRRPPAGPTGGPRPPTGRPASPQGPPRRPGRFRKIWGAGRPHPPRPHYRETGHRRSRRAHWAAGSEPAARRGLW